MGKLTVDKLKDLKIKIEKENQSRKNKNRVKITVHMGTCGIASGANDIYNAFTNEIKENKGKDIMITTSGCIGICSREPLATIEERGKDPVIYEYLTRDKVRDIYRKHVMNGEISDYAMAWGSERDKKAGKPVYTGGDKKSGGKEIPHILDIPFFGKQKLIVLKNKGIIDAEKIDEYIARDGYMGAAKALSGMSPDDVIKEVLKSGLRGRGGGGFPTGMKWSFAKKSQSDIKYIICNADEGDPGAFMDRSVLEADPHSVLEGMIIGGYAIGANEGYIYCRAEYPLAIKRLTIAIEQARKYGLLGRNILGTGYSLDIHIYQGAGAFVCGEETALMMSIEGNRGTPRPRPPFPAVKGLWQKPSVLNNVETFANIPQIILNGGDWYSSIGTEGSKGTKVFALTGAVNNVGLVEVPMGTPIGDIIFDIGGGIKKGKKFKAAQLGGPSGGCIPANALNTPTDYEEIIKLGAIMGSGGLIVMDEDTCMVDTARFFMEFCQEESCGKCTPCREGTNRMLEILTRITQGDGRKGDIELLEDLAGSIKDSALCGLGQTAPNPVLSTIKYFRDEYEAHIDDKKCVAAVCSSLFTSPCSHECPIGMDIPAYMALVKADRLTDAYKVLKQTNPFPGVCGRVCAQFCVSKCRRGQIDEPMAAAWIKRYIADNADIPRVKKLPTIRKEKIAVIGGGPAGLTIAHDLRLRGYAVTVFEDMPIGGGMMRYTIPEYRMPKAIVEQEVADIAALGIELKTNVRVGKDIKFNDIYKNYDIVAIAVGAHQSWKLGIKGEETKGVWGAVDFLKEVNLGNKVDIGSKVVIVGGGNTAIDSARTAIRLGAKDVKILYRREREDMPAWESEIQSAEAEGVKIEYLVAPVRIVGNGRVTGIECIRMRLGEFDSQGRRKPIPIDGSEFIMDTDAVISAISQNTNTSFIPKDSGIKTDKSGAFVTSGKNNNRTTLENVFISGEAASGPATVVEAIAMSRKTATDIDNYIRIKNGEPLCKKPREEYIDIPFPNENEEVIEIPRGKMPEIGMSERLISFKEVEMGYTERTAREEASRCLRCDAGFRKNYHNRTERND